MWQDFIQALKELSDAYAALLAISRKKRAALVAVDLKGLEPLIKDEGEQLERIRAAEKRRRDALFSLSGMTPSFREDATMAEVETACPPKLRGELKKANASLSRLVEEIREASDANAFLIHHALGAVEYHLNRIGNSSVDPTYGGKGEESVTRERKFDFRA